MLAQRLRHAIRIERPNTALDEYGGAIGGFVTHADNVRASVEPVSAREVMVAGANASEQPTRIVMRYRSDLTTAMRIAYGGRWYAIHGIVDVGELHRMLELNCTVGVAES